MIKLKSPIRPSFRNLREYLGGEDPTAIQIDGLEYAHFAKIYQRAASLAEWRGLKDRAMGLRARRDHHTVLAEFRGDQS